MILDLIDRVATVFGAATTVRSASAEWGPPPGAVYGAELAKYTDAELYERDMSDVLDEIRATGGRRVLDDRKADHGLRG